MLTDTVPLDTSAESDQLVVARLREMSPVERLTLALRMSRTVRELALAGIRHRHPAASPREQQLRLAIVILGRNLALAAYPDIANLSDE